MFDNLYKLMVLKKLKKYRNKNICYKAELHKKNFEIEQIYSSYSWRITKPFRAL